MIILNKTFQINFVVVNTTSNYNVRKRNIVVKLISINNSNIVVKKKIVFMLYDVIEILNSNLIFLFIWTIQFLSFKKKLMSFKRNCNFKNFVKIVASIIEILIKKSSKIDNKNNYFERFCNDFEDFKTNFNAKSKFLTRNFCLIKLVYCLIEQELCYNFNFIEIFSKSSN